MTISNSCLMLIPSFQMIALNYRGIFTKFVNVFENKKGQGEKIICTWGKGTMTILYLGYIDLKMDVYLFTFLCPKNGIWRYKSAWKFSLILLLFLSFLRACSLSLLRFFGVWFHWKPEFKFILKYRHFEIFKNLFHSYLL